MLTLHNVCTPLLDLHSFDPWCLAKCPNLWNQFANVNKTCYLLYMPQSKHYIFVLLFQIFKLFFDFYSSVSFCILSISFPLKRNFLPDLESYHRFLKIIDYFILQLCAVPLSNYPSSNFNNTPPLMAVPVKQENYIQ